MARFRADISPEYYVSLSPSSVDPYATKMTSALAYTPVSQIPQLVSEARRAFDSGKTRPIEWRIQQIKALRKMMMENYEPIHKAMYADLRKPETEAIVAEVRDVPDSPTNKLLSQWRFNHQSPY